MYTKLPLLLRILLWPWVWPHEYCHYWMARRLGRLARIQGTRTYVHRVNLVQHILIALAPTAPNLFLVGISVYGFLNLADSAGQQATWGILAGIAVVLLLSCAMDWWVVLKSLADPDFLDANSSAILIITPSSFPENRLLRVKLENMGYFLDWARSQQAAVAALRQNPFSLIVIDSGFRELDLNAFRMEVSLYQGGEGPRIVALRPSEALSQVPLFLEIGLPPDRFV